MDIELSDKLGGTSMIIQTRFDRFSELEGTAVITHLFFQQVSVELM